MYVTTMSFSVSSPVGDIEMILTRFSPLSIVILEENAPVLTGEMTWSEEGVVITTVASGLVRPVMLTIRVSVVDSSRGLSTTKGMEDAGVTDGERLIVFSLAGESTLLFSYK